MGTEVSDVPTGNNVLKCTSKQRRISKFTLYNVIAMFLACRTETGQ